MTDNQLNEILSRLDAIALKFNKVGPELWEMLTRQALVESLTYSGLLIAGGVLLHKLIKHIRARIAKEDRTYMSDGLLFTTIFTGIYAVAYAGATLIISGDIITGFVNPDFQALDYLLRRIK